MANNSLQIIRTLGQLRESERSIKIPEICFLSSKVLKIGRMNWRERVDQSIRAQQEIEADRQAALSRQVQLEAIKKAEATKQAQQQSERDQKEIEAILQRFGVFLKLQQIRNEIWQAGNIDNKGTFVALYYDYQFALHDEESVKFSGGLEPSVHTIDHGYKVSNQRTSLIVGAQANSSLIKREPSLAEKGGYSLYIMDNAFSLTAPGGDRFPQLSSYIPSTSYYPEYRRYSQLFEKVDIQTDSPQASEMLDEILLRSCISRNRKHHLPLDLKRSGEEEIKRLVPWHRRLFH